MANAPALGADAARLEGSSPSLPTKTAIFFFARGRPGGLREVVCWLNECKFEWWKHCYDPKVPEPNANPRRQPKDLWRKDGEEYEDELFPECRLCGYKNQLFAESPEE